MSPSRRILLASLLLAAPACDSPAESRPPRRLLLIAVDTLRADHLGAYGYGRETSPAVDALFESAVVFEDAQATSSWTLPSLASLMTGLYPSSHRCFTFRSRLDDSYTTLAEILSERGYRTAGVVSHVFLGDRYGLHQGFEHYDQELVLADAQRSHEQISSERVTDKALELLSELDDSWFLFVHYFDPHAVYNEHADIGEDFGADDMGRYDGEIAFTDHHIARLLEGLEQRGLAEQTVVVFVADHGEEFEDHGLSKHGKTLHQEVLRVPLAIRAPGLSARRVSETVGAIDILPTVMELLAEAPVDTAGRSLVPLMRGESLEPRGSLAELRLKPEYPADALVEGRWKLIIDRNPGHTALAPAERGPPALLLFDRSVDPQERENVAARHPDVVEDLRARLRAAVQGARKLGARFREAAQIEHTPEELEILRNLGYAR